MLFFIGGITGLQASTLDLRQNSKTKFIQVDKFVKAVNQVDIAQFNLQTFDTDTGVSIFRCKYQSNVINLNLEQKSLNKERIANIQNNQGLSYKRKQNNKEINTGLEILILKHNICLFTDVGIHKV
jgi:hypothetical protein